MDKVISDMNWDAPGMYPDNMPETEEEKEQAKIHSRALFQKLCAPDSEELRELNNEVEETYNKYVNDYLANPNIKDSEKEKIPPMPEKVHFKAYNKVFPNGVNSFFDILYNLPEMKNSKEPISNTKDLFYRVCINDESPVTDEEKLTQKYQLFKMFKERFGRFATVIGGAFDLLDRKFNDDRALSAQRSTIDKLNSALQLKDLEIGLEKSKTIAFEADFRKGAISADDVIEGITGEVVGLSKLADPRKNAEQYAERLKMAQDMQIYARGKMSLAFLTKSLSELAILSNDHFTRTRPNFFQRFFRRPVARAYAAEREVMNGYVSMLKEAGVSKDLLDKITRRSTTMAEITADEIKGAYNKVVDTYNKKELENAEYQKKLNDEFKKELAHARESSIEELASPSMAVSQHNLAMKMGVYESIDLEEKLDLSDDGELDDYLSFNYRKINGKSGKILFDDDVISIEEHFEKTGEQDKINELDGKENIINIDEPV
ncbi:MAG: hypothetical protein KBS59_04610, partial [Clostridiales bacterium]|nr:hypothetical protein [Clostridiales bacterium]